MAVWNLIAGILAAIGGIVAIYVAYPDVYSMNMLLAILALLSGIAWIISAVIGLRQR